MELWGHCATCDRWFYLPSAAVDSGDGSRDSAGRCPVCGAEPTALENRAVT